LLCIQGKGSLSEHPELEANYSRWSFGSNKIQMKAELRLLAQVAHALQSVTTISAKSVAARQSLHAKQELLTVLLQSETSNLNVWLYPTDSEGSHVGALQVTKPNEVRTKVLYHRSTSSNSVRLLLRICYL